MALCCLTPLAASPAEVAQSKAPASAGAEVAPAIEAPGVPTLQMTTDFAQPSLAFGDYRPIGTVESRGMRLAPFTVRAVLQTVLGYDSNLARSDVNRTGSFFTAISPSVALGLEGATQRYYAIYRGSYGKYFSSSQDDYNDHDLGVSAWKEWSARLRTSFNYDFVRTHIPRDATVTPELERWDWTSTRASASYGAEGAPGRIETEVGYLTRRILTDRLANARRDYDQLDLGGSFQYRLAPKTRGIVQITRSAIEHPNDPTLDSTEMRYLVGATWDALAKTQGTLRVGYMTKDFALPSREDFGGASYEANVVWKPRTYSVVDLNARRAFGESVQTRSNFVVATTAAGTWNHDWNSRSRTSLRYAYGNYSYQGTMREDTYHSVGGEASYGLRRWLRVGAQIRHDTRSSTLPGLNYTRKITVLSIESAL